MTELIEMDSLHSSLQLAENLIGFPPSREINLMSARSAMGLPEHYVSTGRTSLSEVFGTLCVVSPEALINITTNSDEPFELRLAAGTLLGLIGDPRISPFNPSMHTVPSGRYWVGTKFEDISAVVREFAPYGVRQDWINKEAPAHIVQLPAYRIAEYPVTNLEFGIFLKETGYTPLPTSWRFGQYPLGHSNHPVHTISAECADAYVIWLSDRTKRNFRLPSEPEWEVAAGAGHRTYPWGDTFKADCANTVETGILDTTPVGIFPAGRAAFGSLDMAGNVEEYVADAYYAYSGSDEVSDDLLEKYPGYRVARGGSFTRYRDLARCCRRHGRYESELYVMGFRIAESI